MILFAPFLVGFLLVLFRCMALFSVAPIFASKSVSPKLRIAIALPVSFAVYVGAGSPSFAAWQSLPLLLSASLVETLIGLVAGMGAKFAMETAYSAGYLASLSMGLGFGSIVDPFEGAESTSVAELFGLLALGAFVSMGGARDMIVWLARTTLPAMAHDRIDVRSLLGTAAAAGISGIGMAVRLAYPVMAAVLIGQVALGMLGRAAPQLNISSVGFSVTILAGGAVVYMITPTVAELVSRATLRVFTG